MSDNCRITSHCRRVSIKFEIRKMRFPQNNDAREINIGDSDIRQNSIMETLIDIKFDSLLIKI